MPPTPPDLTRARRVLIVKLSAIGDILHALPVSAALSDAFPHLKLYWAVEAPFAPLLEANDTLSGILPVPKLRPGRLTKPEYRRAYFGALREVGRGGFDVVLDLQGLTKSAVIALASGAKARVGYHWLRELARVVETPAPHQPESVHIVDQYLDVARWLGANPERVRFPYRVADIDRESADRLLRDAGIAPGRSFISVNPASARANKQWGADRYAALMDTVGERTGTPAVLVTADAAVADEVRRAAARPFVNLTGKTSLKELAAVLQRGAVHVCGDTGSGHLAAALNRPVVSLFGPTDPDRSCPYGQRENVLSRRDLCDPACTPHHCRFARPKCLDAVTVEDATTAVIRNIASDEGKP